MLKTCLNIAALLFLQPTLPLGSIQYMVLCATTLLFAMFSSKLAILLSVSRLILNRHLTHTTSYTNYTNLHTGQWKIIIGQKPLNV